MKRSKRDGEGSSRRGFLKGAAASSIALIGNRFTALSALGAKDAPASVASRDNPREQRFIAIQVGAVSFVDEGIEKVLDIFQERARVNALMLAVFTYGRGIAGRQIPGQPLPDHGAQSYDTETFRGGSYSAIHSQYYSKTILKNFRAPDLGSFDLLAEVVPKAKARGIQSYCWLEDVYNPRFLPNFEKVVETDVHGKRTGHACLNHPEIRNFLCALVEDYVRSHPIDGVMWGSERQGPLGNAIGAHHGGFKGEPSITCFCEFCRKKGTERGISVARAQEGFTELDKFVRALWAGKKPSDGAFVTFWRMLLEYPEILAWEKLWTDSQQDVYRELYHSIKRIKPQVKVGWHIWHNNSFSPFYRSEQDYRKLRPNSDFLKVVMYNNCGGPRLAQYIRNVQGTIFRDIRAEELLSLNYQLLGYGGEAAYENISVVGLSAGYVASETKRAIAGVGGEIPIYPGIDIDIPTGAGEKKTEPSDVRAAVKAAFQAGANGVILSRKYSEMKLANLTAAGDALKELGIG